jgi:quaternary ammonium compound-resistance protein SugE
MKSSAGLTRVWPSLLMSLSFLIGAALQALVMRDADMSVSYVSVLGLESLFAFALGVLILGETVSVIRLCAIVMITAGVVLLNR